MAGLDGSAKVPLAQLPASVVGTLDYVGTWNASTNTPTLTSGTGTKGQFYKVSVAGATTLDGISVWNVGDSAVFDGATWDKVDGITNEVVSVAGLTGVIAEAALAAALAGTTGTTLAVGNDARIIGTPVAVTANGTTQSGATPLTGQFNLVTLSTGNTAVSLQAIIGEQNIVNTQPVGGLAMLVFPLGSSTINGGAAGASVSIPGGTSVTFRSTNGTAFTGAIPIDPAVVAANTAAIASLGGVTITAAAMASGTPYTIPSGTSVMLFTQTATQAAVTVTLPASPGNGQLLEMDNSTGQITALTFSPAIAGWTNGSTLTPNSTINARYFTALSAWQRVQ